MKNKLCFISLPLILAIPLNLTAADILVDSLNRIEPCIEFFKSLKLPSDKNILTSNTKTIEYRFLLDQFSAAYENFYKLDISKAEQDLDEIIKIISDAFISGGHPEDIYDLFGRSLLYKMLILLTQKKDNEALEVFKGYFTIISKFPLNSKEFHPALIDFIKQKGPIVQETIKSDTEISTYLKKALNSKYSPLFDSAYDIPSIIPRSRHILIISLPNNIYRTFILDLSSDNSYYFLVQNYENNAVYLFLGEDAFKRFITTHPKREIVYCSDKDNGYIPTDKKQITEEKVPIRGMSRETVNLSTSTPVRWYSKWWVYAGGGILVAGIIASIILLNTGDQANDNFSDHIHLK